MDPNYKQLCRPRVYTVYCNIPSASCNLTFYILLLFLQPKHDTQKILKQQRLQTIHNYHNNIIFILSKLTVDPLRVKYTFLLLSSSLMPQPMLSPISIRWTNILALLSSINSLQKQTNVSWHVSISYLLHTKSSKNDQYNLLFSATGMMLVAE